MATSHQVPLIWRKAIERYEEITKTTLLDDPNLKSLATVDDLQRAIDDENRRFGDFREKRHGVFAVLTVAMRPIELIGGLAADAASATVPPGTLVFCTVKHLIDAAKGVSEEYDAIMQLLATLKVGLHPFSTLLMARSCGVEGIY
jgi:hypothetical protein